MFILYYVIEISEILFNDTKPSKVSKSKHVFNRGKSATLTVTKSFKVNFIESS